MKRGLKAATLFALSFGLTYALGDAPLPSCLPRVPHCGDRDTALLEGSDGLCRPGD